MKSFVTRLGTAGPYPRKGGGITAKMIPSRANERMVRNSSHRPPKSNEKHEVKAPLLQLQQFVRGGRVFREGKGYQRANSTRMLFRDSGGGKDVSKRHITPQNTKEKVLKPLEPDFLEKVRSFKKKICEKSLRHSERETTERKRGTAKHSKHDKPSSSSRESSNPGSTVLT